MKFRSLVLVVFLIVTTLAACAPKVDPNTEFVQNLKALVGTTNPAEIPSIAHQYTDTDAFANWMKNAELGTFVNVRGEEVPVATVGGEPRYTLQNKRQETKWVEPLGETWTTTCIGPNGNENHIVVYASGNAGTIGRLKRDEESLQQFACAYFSQSIAPINVMHLNFHSTGVPVQLADVGNYGVVMPLLPFDWDMTSSLAGNHRRDDGTVDRGEVILQLNNLQGSSEQIGLTTTQVITMSLVNEWVGLISAQQVNMQLSGHNESYSTIAGLAAAFDPATARLFLSSDYEAAIRIVVDEMLILTNIANR